MFVISGLGRAIGVSRACVCVWKCISLVNHCIPPLLSRVVIKTGPLKYYVPIDHFQNHSFYSLRALREQQVENHLSAAFAHQSAVLLQ